MPGSDRASLFFTVITGRREVCVVPEGSVPR